MRGYKIFNVYLRESEVSLKCMHGVGVASSCFWC